MKKRLAFEPRHLLLAGITSWLAVACDAAPDVGEAARESNTISSDVAYEYDALDRLTAVRYESGDVMRYSYDEAGNILTVEMDKAE